MSKNMLNDKEDAASQFRVLTKEASDVACRNFEEVAFQCSASTLAMLETDQQEALLRENPENAEGTTMLRDFLLGLNLAGVRLLSAGPDKCIVWGP